jgi:hypothetical protein
VLGHVSDKEGRKEAKSRGNYTPPEIILDRVRMDFAVLDAVEGVTVAPGEAYIAREDLEGMDLADGAQIVAYRPQAEQGSRKLRVRASKKLPRRVALLAPDWCRPRRGSTFCRQRFRASPSSNASRSKIRAGRRPAPTRFGGSSTRRRRPGATRGIA